MKEELNRRKSLEEEIKSLLNSSDLKDIKSFLKTCKIQDHEGIKKLIKRRNILKKLGKIEKNKIEFKLTFNELDELINDSLKQSIAHDKLDPAKLIHQQFILLDNSINRFIFTNENVYYEEDDIYNNLHEKINSSIVYVTQKKEFENLLKSREWFFNTLKIFKIYEKPQNVYSITNKLQFITVESLFKLPEYYELINKVPLSLMKLQLDLVSMQEMIGPAKKLRHNLEISYHCLLLEEELKKNQNGKIKIDNINLINSISSYNLPNNTLFYDFINKMKLLNQEFDMINSKYNKLIINSLDKNISESEVSEYNYEASTLLESMKRSSFDFETNIRNLQNAVSQIYYCQELQKLLEFQVELNDAYLENFYQKGIDIKFPETENFLKLLSIYDEYKKFKEILSNYVKKSHHFYVEKTEFQKMMQFFKSIRIKTISELLENDFLFFQNLEQNSIQLLKKFSEQEFFSNEDLSKIKNQTKMINEIAISNSEIMNNLMLMEWVIEATLIINSNFENSTYESLTKLCKNFHNLIIKDFDTIKVNRLQSQILSKLAPSSLISEECKKDHFDFSEVVNLNNKIKSLSIVNPLDAGFVTGLINQAGKITEVFEQMKNKRSSIEEYEQFALHLDNFPVIMHNEETQLENIIFKAKKIQEYALSLIKESENFEKRIPLIKIKSLIEDPVNNYCLINEIVLLSEKIEISKQILQKGKELLDKEYQEKNDSNQICELKNIHSLLEKSPIDLLEEEISFKKQLWRKILVSFSSFKPTFEDLNFLINFAPSICFKQDLIKKNTLNKLKIESEKYISMISELKNEEMLNSFNQKIKDFEINLFSEIDKKRIKLINDSKIKQIEISKENEGKRSINDENFMINSSNNENNSSKGFSIDNSKFNKSFPLAEHVEITEKKDLTINVFERMNDQPEVSNDKGKHESEIVINPPANDIKTKVNEILRLNPCPLKPDKILEFSNKVEIYLKSISYHGEKYYNDELNKILLIVNKINTLPLISKKLNLNSKIIDQIASKFGSEDLILRLIRKETRLRESQKNSKSIKDNQVKNQKETTGKKRDLKVLKKNQIQEMNVSSKKNSPSNINQNPSTIEIQKKNISKDKDNEDSDSVYSLIADSEKISYSEENKSAHIKSLTNNKKQQKNTPKKDIPYDPFSNEQFNKPEAVPQIKPKPTQISKSNLQKIAYDPLNPNYNE